MLRTWARLWLIVLAAFGLGLAAGMPAARAGLISEQQELQMGADAASQVEARYPVSKDARKNALVEGIGKRLTAVSSRPKLPWKFKVLETPEINALSVPGFVYVNSGLLDFIKGDRDQLAAVIAHEVAHTTRKHAVRQTEKSLVGSLALRFLFKGEQSLTSKLAGMATNLAMLGYGRKDELEADRVGTEYMIQGGYNSTGMIRFFEKLRAQEGKEAGGLSVYFRSHPPTSERIQKVQSYVNSRRG